MPSAITRRDAAAASGCLPTGCAGNAREIEALGERYGIRTLCASEVDILPDGSLDYDDGVLAELDVVVASVHSAMHQSRDEMTARLIRACENPYVTIIGHPTGRRFDGGAGYEFDYDAVFAAAARTGTALEIDGQAMRLDLPAPLVRKAKAFGVTFTADSDAHRTGDLVNAELAVGQARRAGLTKDDVLNAGRTTRCARSSAQNERGHRNRDDTHARAGRRADRSARVRATPARRWSSCTAWGRPPPSGTRSWRSFRATYRCVAIELRGNGVLAPDPNPALITREGFAQRRARRRGRARHRAIMLVGCSLGGVVAFELWGACPNVSRRW